MIKNLSAVILGTRSGPRLKTPIPLLPFGDATVLSRTLHAYLDAGFAEVILVVGAGGYEFRSSLGPLAGRIQLVEAGETEDRFAALVRAGVERVSTASKGSALGLADQPLLTPEVLGQLAAHFVESKTRILAPGWQGHLGHPVFFDAALHGELRQLKPDTEMWDIIKTHGKEILVHEVGSTAVVRRIEDRTEYHEHLRLAGLPVPEPTPVDPPIPAVATGNGGSPDQEI